MYDSAQRSFNFHFMRSVVADMVSFSSLGLYYIYVIREDAVLIL